MNRREMMSRRPSVLGNNNQSWKEQVLREPVTFECLRLKGTNKEGVLKPDADGCYEICVGALNAFNHAEAYYVYEEAKHFFESNSSFMRKIERGVVRAEYGHPKKEPGMSMADFGDRLMRIEETRVCATIRKIWLLPAGAMKDGKGRPVIAIMAKIMPSGPYGEVLRKQLETAAEQVCFSIRSFTEDWVQNGVVHKAIRQLINFDYVNEPGMYNAEKLLSPSMECIDSATFTKGELIQSLDRHEKMGYSMESAPVSKSELMTNLGLNRKSDVAFSW